MTIPAGFIAPSLTNAADEYDREDIQRLVNLLRLYFSKIDNQNQVANEQLAASQTLIWLDM